MSFDRTESFRADVVAPAARSDLAAMLARGTPVIPRGAGLTYCAASAGSEVRSVTSTKLNRILAFDEEAGVIDVEPGVTLGQLYRFAAPRGWVLPVMPGHPSITIGGCIACNVHGKNQYREGNFVNVVDEVMLWHPDYGEIRCSRTHEPTVFDLTVGGFGLTGFITSARLKLQRAGGSAMRIRRIPVSDLTDTVETMQRHAGSADLLYSWNDLNSSGRKFGQGFVYVGCAEPSSADDRVAFRRLHADGRGVLPVNVYRGLTTRWLLNAYRWSQDRSPAETVVSMARAVFPVNGKEFYFRFFGRNGFREYQVLVPPSRWSDVNDRLSALIARIGIPVTLGSLKLFRGSSELLRFGGCGVVLTLDVPNSREALILFGALDELALSCGAIVNLAKDGRVSAALARQVLPGYERFTRELQAFDRHRRFDSALRRRLEL